MNCEVVRHRSQSAVLAPDGKCTHTLMFTTAPPFGTWKYHTFDFSEFVVALNPQVFSGAIFKVTLKKEKKYRCLAIWPTTYLESGICFNHSYFFCSVCGSLVLFVFSFNGEMIRCHTVVTQVSVSRFHFFLFCRWSSCRFKLECEWLADESRFDLVCVCNVSFSDRRDEWSERGIKETGFNVFCFLNFFLCVKKAIFWWQRSLWMIPSRAMKYLTCLKWRINEPALYL